MTKQSAYYHADSSISSRDAKAAKRSLDELPGVFSVSVNQDDARIAVDYDSTGVSAEQIESRLQKLGLHVTPDSSDSRIL